VLRADDGPNRNGTQQLVFYQSGVGSVTDFNASTVFGTTTTRQSLLQVVEYDKRI
jgi:hypothetical protein